jgi:hypothetical protein
LQQGLFVLKMVKMGCFVERVGLIVSGNADWVIEQVKNSSVGSLFRSKLAHIPENQIDYCSFRVLLSPS